MKIKIKNHKGDILGDYAVKNIMNYNSSNDHAKIIKEVSDLILVIQQSNINDKNILIQNIQEKTDEPSKLAKYLKSLEGITTISSNITTVLQAIGFASSS